MNLNLAQKLIQSHLVDGEMRPGEQIGLRMDQALVQDATGTLVMLTLEALRLERIKTDFAVQYVDHNLLQEDHRNPEDHIFLESAAKHFGLWFSPPGNGVSHPLHQAFFGVPGQSLIGSDSHTPAAGALGMLAFGAGGMDVAMALAGEPYRIPTPKIWGIRLTGKLPDWVSAKDVILEMLRRHGVDGGLGRIIEYYGPGLAHLSAMDRHVIANMGTELGATTTVFPSDGAVEYYLAEQGRESDWQELLPDDGAAYDFHDEIDLSKLEPLIALPSSPDSVVPVREVAGDPIYQAYIGSSANPGHRDFAIVAEMVRGQHIAPGVSFDINPTSRILLEGLIRDGHLTQLLRAGARLHQAGCNGCIGMGQAPAKGRNSLRTVPRNFPARSGTREDSVFLCSPETATASALRGVITDPRDLDLTVVDVRRPTPRANKPDMFLKPLPQARAKSTALIKGSNIQALPELEPMPGRLHLPILIKAEDNISTDEIMPAGSQVLPFRSNIQKLAEFAFRDLDEAYATKASATPANLHMIVGGENYGQGSSREHAALAPRYLGLRVVLAKSFARIHRQNLINYGVLPLVFDDPNDYERMSCGQTFSLMDVPDEVRRGMLLELIFEGEKNNPVSAVNDLDAREREIVLAGGMINWYQENRAA